MLSDDEEEGVMLHLAEAFEGDEPTALVGYDAERPVAYMPFSIRPGRFHFRVRNSTLLRFPYRQLRLALQRPALSEATPLALMAMERAWVTARGLTSLVLQRLRSPRAASRREPGAS
jgi:hypothetical protein